MQIRINWHLLAGIFALSACTLHAQDKAQPKLPTIPLVIGDKKLVAEVADTTAEREAGLMFRKSLTDGEGMLFVFEAPQQLAFWMKNTILPLSVAYLSPAGTILEIHDLKPQDETPIGSKFDTIEYAIEVPQGWFLKSGILPGARVQGLPAVAGP